MNRQILDEIIKLCHSTEWDERNNEYPHCTMRVEWESKYPPHKNFVRVRVGQVATLKTELRVEIRGTAYETPFVGEYIEMATRKILHFLSDEKIPPTKEWSRE